jgi:hypothetical protein
MRPPAALPPLTPRQVLDRSWFWTLRYHPELRELAVDGDGAEAHFGHTAVTDDDLVEKGAAVPQAPHRRWLTPVHVGGRQRSAARERGSRSFFCMHTCCSTSRSPTRRVPGTASEGVYAGGACLADRPDGGIGWPRWRGCGIATMASRARACATSSSQVRRARCAAPMLPRPDPATACGARPLRLVCDEVQGLATWDDFLRAADPGGAAEDDDGGGGMAAATTTTALAALLRRSAARAYRKQYHAPGPAAPGYVLVG